LGINFGGCDASSGALTMKCISCGRPTNGIWKGNTVRAVCEECQHPTLVRLPKGTRPQVVVNAQAGQTGNR
jgi:NMD protein affecting ribosome stability and mRNA decay